MKPTQEPALQMSIEQPMRRDSAKNAKMRARDALTRLVQHLRTYALPFPVGPHTEPRKHRAKQAPKPIAWASFCADSVDRYLRGDAKSLDHAFGLVPRGAPRKVDEHRAIAREVFNMRIAGKSWGEIANDIAANNGTVTDERTLRRIYREFLVEFLADEISLDDLLR